MSGIINNNNNRYSDSVLTRNNHEIETSGYFCDAMKIFFYYYYTKTSLFHYNKGSFDGEQKYLCTYIEHICKSVFFSLFLLTLHSRRNTLFRLMQLFSTWTIKTSKKKLRERERERERGKKILFQPRGKEIKGGKKIIIRCRK